MHSPKKQSIILCIKLTTQRCITDRMSTQEAYLDCSKHCATFPLEHTIHTAVVAQVLLLVLVVKISVTELSSVPPPHPLVSSKTPELCHMTSVTIPHLTVV